MTHFAHGRAFDLAILPLYFVAAIVIGWLARGAGRNSRTFLNASRSLPLPVVVAAYLATNCGALEVVGLNAMAAQYGVQAFQFYWIGAVPAMIFLAIWMMPVYRRSNITSVPEYLERRFGHKVRLLNACVVGLALLLLAGISLYAMAEVLQVLMGWGFGVGVVISAGVVLTYILLGGIKATIYNEVFQLVIMLAGLVPLCIRSHSLNTRLLPTSAPGSIHLWSTLPFASNQAPLDQFGVIFGLGFVLSFGYWCTDFVLMQRAFTARTENDARQVPLWAGLGKLCFSLIVVLPGLAAGRIFPSLAHSQRFDQALPMLMMRLYSPGMLGLGMTAIIASLMSGLAANISAFAAIVTNDIYRAHLRSDAEDAHYLWVGRWISLAAIGFSGIASYLNFFFHDLMEHVQLIFSVFGAPFWAIFLLGMASRRTNSRGALLGFFSGTGVALIHLVAQTRGWIHYGSNMNADFHVAIYAFTTAIVVGYFGSTRETRIPSDTLVFHWRTGLMQSQARLWILSLLLAAATIALNIYWR